MVASYLLAPGRFADRVGDRSLAAGAAAVSAPLGAAPEVADVLLGPVPGGHGWGYGCSGLSGKLPPGNLADIVAL